MRSCVGACNVLRVSVCTCLRVSDVEENKQRRRKTGEQTGEGRREGASLFKSKFLVYLFD